MLQPYSKTDDMIFFLLKTLHTTPPEKKYFLKILQMY